RFPFLALVRMRGDFGEGNPWQFPMGQAVEPVLEAMGVICLRIERPEEAVPTVSAALTMVFQSGHAVAVLLTQQLLGAKRFLRRRAVAGGHGRGGAAAPAFILDGWDAVPTLIGRHEDFLIVSGLAGTSRDVASLTGDGAHTYTMAGAMGGACMIGLGLALARPDKR